MKFTTTILLLILLAAASPAISPAEGLPDLATSGEGGYSLSHGEALQLAAKFPRKCSPAISAAALRSVARRNAARILRDTAVPMLSISVNGLRTKGDDRLSRAWIGGVLLSKAGADMYIVYRMVLDWHRNLSLVVTAFLCHPKGHRR
ncbi:hypothetical protein FVER53590_28305 [Fusarium verticillioides]|nr:hypothetical protein FVER14953_20106 [Fusarium verticillioides]RBQ99078.1 hypothetical protein FVER53263_20211 [Fusarium verticillioides]RBR22745.1 hypothetical protein FVER53590_28305 [Fusarium verticillioides]